MPVDKVDALKAGAADAAYQIVSSFVPGVAVLVEPIRKYDERIKEKQRNDLLNAMHERQDALEARIDWFHTDDGQIFFKKIVATCLNPEYSDKLEFLANALVNGPSLKNDEARRMKFVELIRQLSKSALEVLVVSVKLTTSDGDILVDRIADYVQWHPELVESCVRELHSLGAYSHITRWQAQNGKYRPDRSFMNEKPGVAPITRQFAAFIQTPDEIATN